MNRFTKIRRRNWLKLVGCPGRWRDLLPSEFFRPEMKRFRGYYWPGRLAARPRNAFLYGRGPTTMVDPLDWRNCSAILSKRP